ncbi:hypothetical protein ACJX0J_020575, partial [Zea mays]
FPWFAHALNGFSVTDYALHLLNNFQTHFEMSSLLGFTIFSLNIWLVDEGIPIDLMSFVGISLYNLSSTVLSAPDLLDALGFEEDVGVVVGGGDPLLESVHNERVIMWFCANIS